MSVLSSFSLLWSQMALPGVSARIRPLLTWLFLIGEPSISIPGIWGGVLTWLKVVSLFSLLAWVTSWLTSALKDRAVGKGNWLDIAALVAFIASPGAVLLRVLETTGRIPVCKIGGFYLVTLAGVACGAIVFLWIELALWKEIRRRGKAADILVFDCERPEAAVAELVAPMYGFKRGRQTFTRAPAQMHR